MKDDDEDEDQEFFGKSLKDWFRVRFVFEIKIISIVYLDQNDNDNELEQISARSSQSIEQNSSGVDESLRRTPSSLNSYSVLPPIRPGMTDDDKKQKASIKKLKEKYVMIEDQPEKNGTDWRWKKNQLKIENVKHLGSIELGKNDKLDDAYLKMKRLDKALEEAFEKERQVKIETMSLMKKWVVVY